MYDTNTNPSTYTGNESIDIADNEISLNVPIKTNGEIVFHPRNHTNAVFEMVT